MTADELVITTDRGRVRVLTMNRPAARNALNRDLIRALYAALKAADDDDTVGAVVLTGTDPAFCAGIDLKEAARDGMKYFAEFRSHSCISAVAEMRTPTVGAINGSTFTGGLELAIRHWPQRTRSPVPRSTTWRDWSNAASTSCATTSAGSEPVSHSGSRRPTRP